VRILYFADIRFPLERANGIQTMETCHALVERGHTVHLVVRPDTKTPPRDPWAYYGLPRRDRLVIERAPNTGPAVPVAARRLGYLAFAAGRATGVGRADVVMTRDLMVASLVLRLPARLSARPPVVYESHGYAPDVAAALPDMVSTATAPSQAKLSRLAAREARVWSRAEGYVTITSGLAEDLTRRFGPRERLAVVPDGTRAVQVSDSRTPPQEGPLTVGYAGHLYAWKGVDILLQAIAKVPGIHGLIVGGHDKEQDLSRLRALAGRLGIDERVTFTGQVAPASVQALLARASVLALPNPASAISTRATSPLKLFEYMAAGRAIVASDLPALREVLTHEVNGLLVAPGDPDALAAGIRRLSGDPDLRDRLARTARDTAAEYSWSRRAERLEALFNQVRRSRAQVRRSRAEAMRPPDAQ
jgi:glycosyltransferase involved in cell wall biosynthesis